MPFSPSFTGKTFAVSDAKALIRDPNDLSVLTKIVIPQGTQVRVTEVKTLPTGSKSRIVFANTMAGNGTVLGWTSTRNFQGSFINETVNLLPAGTSTDQKGPNAAWSGGHFLRQMDLVEIVDNGLEIERMTLTTVEPYLNMVAAAKAAGINVAINSGFRSFAEQALLFQGFQQGLPGFNQAAPPGSSNHQNGIALDIAVSGGAGTPVYDWLAENATSFGFVRTVNGEPWHWECDLPKATAAKSLGTCKAPGVTK